MKSSSNSVDNHCGSFLALVKNANEAMNLVSRKDVDNLLTRLHMESLLPIEWSRCNLASPLLDIGSGGGFPGIPLKLVKPELSITLMDSNRRKVSFLKLAIDHLGLCDASAVCVRAEDAAVDPAYRAAYGTVVSRGVAGLQAMLGWAAWSLRPGGELILWKGSETRDEYRQADLSGWSGPDSLEATNSLTLQRFVRLD